MGCRSLPSATLNNSDDTDTAPPSTIANPCSKIFVFIEQESYSDIAASNCVLDLF